jgi:archaellum component FlaC
MKNSTIQKQLNELKEDLNKLQNVTKEIIFFKKKINEINKIVQDMKEELNKAMKMLTKK